MNVGIWLDFVAPFFLFKSVCVSRLETKVRKGTAVALRTNESPAKV